MPTFINPRRVDVQPRGGGGGVAALLAVLVAVAAGVWWLLADTVFLPVAITVVSVLCVAGTVRIVHELRSTRGMMWRPPRPVEEAVPVPVALPAAEPPLAIEAPKRVLTGVVVERELARVTAEKEG